MSSNDRRASYMSAHRPRAVSNRVVDAEKASPRSSASSFQTENMDQMRGSASSQRNRLSRGPSSAGEKRTERVITTKDKTQVRTRNTMKESISAGNRLEREKSRLKRTSQPDGGSTSGRKREQAEGWPYS